MRRFLMLVAAILAGLLVAGCGSGGSSADAPAGGLNLVAGDGKITVTWSMASGVEYWLWYSSDSSLSASHWVGISTLLMGATSPDVTTGLTNGTPYYFMANGRTNGGPGGPMTPLVSAIPRLAGTVTAGLPAPWTAGAVLGGGAHDLRGVTWGAAFVAVGAGGVMYSSPDGITWTALNSGVLTNLNAAVYRSGVYLAAGDGGTMLYSTDAIAWTPRATGTLNNLYAAATNGTLVVAVGANGTIINSSDGITWTAAVSGTANHLYAVAFTSSGKWIAVGAFGTLVTSADGSTWTAVASNTALDLKGVAYGTSYGTITATNAGVYVAVGASGTLVTSPDAVIWTARPAIGAGANTLSAVTYGTQFIAVGDSGSIFTSTDGTTWAVQPSTTVSNLYAIVHAPYSYSVVGAAGVNLLAQ